jgi:hypothetical protein
VLQLLAFDRLVSYSSAAPLRPLPTVFMKFETNQRALKTLTTMTFSATFQLASQLPIFNLLSTTLSIEGGCLELFQLEAGTVLSRCLSRGRSLGLPWLLLMLSRPKHYAESPTTLSLSSPKSFILSMTITNLWLQTVDGIICSRETGT